MLDVLEILRIFFMTLLVGKAINYINSNLENNLSVSEIANQLYVSPTQYRKIFN